MFNEQDNATENTEFLSKEIKLPASHGIIYEGIDITTRIDDSALKKSRQEILNKFAKLEDKLTKSHEKFQESIKKLQAECNEALAEAKNALESYKENKTIEKPTIKLTEEEKLNTKISLLKQEIIELKQEIVVLKEENATLKSHIRYLWKLMSAFISNQLTALSKNWHAFFSKNKEVSYEPELEKQKDMDCSI